MHDNGKKKNTVHRSKRPSWQVENTAAFAELHDMISGKSASLSGTHSAQDKHKELEVFGKIDRKNEE